MLLTEKQQLYMNLYYVGDLSLGEIAEIQGVSRQAVYDTVRRAEVILEDYEDKLQIVRNFLERNKDADRLMDYARKHYFKDKELIALIERLIQ